MWKFIPFTPKEPTSLEGRYIDVGNAKVYVQNTIAEGGFSRVYLARDAVNNSKKYALKHIICNDAESLEVVVKEISVMKMLKGHPNIVTIVAHAIMDMGRTKEALLVMEFGETSLVNVLEKRGAAAYFEEKQILLIFRDVCNAVLAMHCQSPPIAHRDIKAENILLGADGAWKLCDFGSTSTNHKCFDKAEERGIEEDNIRKYTTPAYRAPEMWDLYRKEVISEKVDIWALGCLLYRLCYLKPAFDGESKLQILNGNYRIPEAPKYSTCIPRLIKDMLEASPHTRPDITQVWFRVNEQLPVQLQKHLPDGTTTGAAKKTTVTPQKKAVQTSAKQIPEASPPPKSSQKSSTNCAAPVGAFWTSHHAENRKHRAEDVTVISNFDTNQKVVVKPKHDEEVINKLKEDLKQVNLEKAEIASKYEKLSAICHSQTREIKDLKQALEIASKANQEKQESTKSQFCDPPIHPQVVTLEKEKLDPGIWELEQAMFSGSCPSSQSWETFPDEPNSKPALSNNQSNNPSSSNSNTTSWAAFPTPVVQGSTSNSGSNLPLGWAGF